MSNNAATQPEAMQKAMLEAVAAATTKVLLETVPKVPAVTPVEVEKDVPADSAAIDLENEPIEKKRERQRSIVLNLGKKVDPRPFLRHPQILYSSTFRRISAY